jgi:hypothetical protein
MPDVAKDRFDGGEAATVECAASRAVDGTFHLVGVAILIGVCLATEEGDLPYLRLSSRCSASH